MLGRKKCLAVCICQVLAGLAVFLALTVLDAAERKPLWLMGIMLFGREPSSQAICAFLGRAMHKANAKPRHLITDRGPQFDCHQYKAVAVHHHRFASHGVCSSKTDLWKPNAVMMMLLQIAIWSFLVAGDVMYRL